MMKQIAKEGIPIPFQRLIVGLISLTMISCTSDNHSKSQKTSLPISNEGLSWIGEEVMSVRIIGVEERKIMQMSDPPVEMLLNCLSDSNRWEAAHVLLTYKCEKSIKSTFDEWNGMKVGDGFDQHAEMEKIYEYWHNKRERNDLSVINPCFSESVLDLYF